MLQYMFLVGNFQSKLVKSNLLLNKIEEYKIWKRVKDTKSLISISVIYDESNELFISAYHI